MRITNRVLMFDSGEGPAMGQPLRPGKNQQQCILYRRSPPTGRFSIRVAVRGASEVWIRDISVCPLIKENSVPNDGNPPILANPRGS